MQKKNEAQATAWAQWEIAAERMTLELAPPDPDEFGERPRDLGSAVQQAQAALDEIKRAFGIDGT